MVRCGDTVGLTEPANKALHLTWAGMTVLREITFLAAGPASERSQLGRVA